MSSGNLTCSRCGGEIAPHPISSEFPALGDSHEDPETCIRNLHERLDRLESNTPKKRNYVIKGYALHNGNRYHGVCTISAYSRAEAIEEFNSKRWSFKLLLDPNVGYNPLGSECYHIDVEPE